MSHREDLQGYLLNLLLQSQSPSLKRPLQRRERRYPKGKRGKLMLARMGITLQKMETPKQTRHRKLKVLEMPSEVCAFLITVYFW
uniref:High mobility group nucleosomal binding domain 2 n=1 Tax=Ursus maritimus TaxID=29073 RepID=A0A452U8R7_URSMA